MNQAEVDRRIQHWEKFEYEMTARKVGSQFVLRIRELSLVASGPSLEKAADELLVKKRQYFNEMLLADAEEEIPMPMRRARYSEYRHELKMFAAKFVIAMMIVFFFAGMGAVFLKGILSGADLFGGLRSAPNQVLSNLESKLIDSSAEKKKHQVERLRKVVDGLQPFAQEIRRLKLCGGNQK